MPFNPLESLLALVIITIIVFGFSAANKKEKIAIVIITILGLIAALFEKIGLYIVLIGFILIVRGFIKADKQTRINMIILIDCIIVFYALKFTLFLYLFGHCSGCSFESGIDFNRKENVLAMGFDTTDVTFVGLTLSSIITYISTIKHLKKSKATKAEMISAIITITYISFTSIVFNEITAYA